MGFDGRLEGGAEVVSEVLGELGSFVGCCPELVQHGLLGWVQLCWFHRAVDRVHVGSMAQPPPGTP